MTAFMEAWSDKSQIYCIKNLRHSGNRASDEPESKSCFKLLNFRLRGNEPSVYSGRAAAS
jgi:hypothetical protein